MKGLKEALPRNPLFSNQFSTLLLSHTFYSQQANVSSKCGQPRKLSEAESGQWTHCWRENSTAASRSKGLLRPTSRRLCRASQGSKDATMDTSHPNRPLLHSFNGHQQQVLLRLPPAPTPKVGPSGFHEREH